MLSRKPLRDWLRDVEGASLARRLAGEEEAAARFDALEPPSRQMALIREIVATRARELTLAYHNVVMVTAGYKASRDGDGTAQVYPQPCVIFVVKRKWMTDAAGPSTQALPSRLLCFGGDDADRRLYAVPTDVQPAAWFRGAAARTASCVRVDDPDPDFRLPGTLTCGVQLQGAVGSAAFALSAMHVLSPVAAQSLPAGDAVLTAVGAEAAVRGRSTAWGGHIDGQTGTAFDAQLAAIDDLTWFEAAFAGLALAPGRPYVATREAFDDLAARMRFQILAAVNHPAHGGAEREPMLAQFTGMVAPEQPIDYQIRFHGLFQTVAVRHSELFQMRVLDSCPPPEPGDSGAAVVSWWPDGSLVLVGMFIASHADVPGRERVCYALPAWQLFDLNNWSALPPGTGAVTPTFSLA